MWQYCWMKKFFKAWYLQLLSLYICLFLYLLVSVLYLTFIHAHAWSERLFGLSFLSVSLSLCFFLSLFLCLSVSLSLCFFLSLSFCFFLSFSVSLSLCLYLSLFLSVSLSLCFFLSLFLSFSVSFFLGWKESKINWYQLVAEVKN